MNTLLEDTKQAVLHMPDWQRERRSGPCAWEGSTRIVLTKTSSSMWATHIETTWTTRLAHRSCFQGRVFSSYAYALRDYNDRCESYKCQP